MKKTSRKLKTRNKFDIISELAKKKNLTFKLSNLCVQTIQEEIINSLLKGQRIELRGFGTFGVKKYKAYKGRNPQNQKRIMVRAKKRPWFKPGIFSQEINN